MIASLTCYWLKFTGGLRIHGSDYSKNCDLLSSVARITTHQYFFIYWSPSLVCDTTSKSANFSLHTGSLVSPLFEFTIVSQLESGSKRTYLNFVLILLKTRLYVPNGNQLNRHLLRIVARLLFFVSISVLKSCSNVGYSVVWSHSRKVVRFT
jgi:hypothetical protein